MPQRILFCFSAAPPIKRWAMVTQQNGRGRWLPNQFVQMTRRDPKPLPKPLAMFGTFAAELGQTATAWRTFARWRSWALLPVEREFIARRIQECEAANRR